MLLAPTRQPAVVVGHPHQLFVRVPTYTPPLFFHPGGFAGRPGYDSEGKALSIRSAFWGKPTPHMVAFHLR